MHNTHIHTYMYRGQESALGIVTGYGLDGPGIEFRWRDEIFRTRPDRPSCLPNYLHNGYRMVHFRGQSYLITYPNLAPRVKKEYRYTSTPLLCLYGRLYGEFAFYTSAHTHTCMWCTKTQAIGSVGKNRYGLYSTFCSNAVDHFRVTLLSPDIIIGTERMTVRWSGYVARKITCDASFFKNNFLCVAIKQTNTSYLNIITIAEYQSHHEHRVGNTLH